ncbi:MAG: TrpB-like pyridoxal phosphate-dependent enzyme [Candidatus Bathyarchaeota archaeon]|jgi:tryptophan synthase beta chain|nr:TrpB-like pyridoxal phosphate-dependent enzyme [Candidatus Bathyarchaeota archaeon A05DMB-3]MDH7606164.1 TrpB-like pyridoxal phosphate-dependent enzyme [Candidatus Bathyarchaeota archaeon]
MGVKVQKNEYFTTLDADEIPTSWYNIQADFPELLPPPLDPTTLKPIDPKLLERIFAKELIRQEVSTERYIKIPDEVLEAYLRLPRPTPLYRARRLEKFLKTPAKIYFKCENFSPTGSHKTNTAIAQAYYNKEQGIKRLVTETGAGQWGTALAFACTIFGLKCRIYMVRVSYQQKPGRKTIAQLYGAEMFPSPSDQTNFGRKLLKENPNHSGTLGIAISEAIEDTVTHEDTRYSLGSVLNHVLLHQTIIGLEAKKQFEIIGEYPDVVCGCIGGGSNYAGFCYPFMMDKLKGKTDAEFIACESKAVPHTTKGVYTYDFGDTAEMTPLLKMLTIGHGYACPPIHAGGLRYHGMAPSISYLITKGYMRSVAYHQTEVFQAAQILAQAEGLIIAPETAHSLKFVIDEALQCRKTGEKRVIAMNYSGHGLLDIGAYEQYLAGRLMDYEPEKIEVPAVNPKF